MKSLLFISILVLTFCGVTFAQKNETLPCPTIEVKTPTDPVQPGETMTFTATIEEEKNPQKFIYDWTVSNGTIIEGRETPVIKVATVPDMAGGSVTATVEIKGLPVNCLNVISETAFIADSVCCKDPGVFDEYEKISFRDEKARLDVVAAELLKEQNTVAIFILYSAKRNTPPTIEQRKARILSYFIETHKIPKDRFTFISGGATGHRTRIYVMPNEAGFSNQNPKKN